MNKPMTGSSQTYLGAFPHLPAWVSSNVRHYLAHTEAGQPIRDLARRCGCHASTILRQVRKIEQRRDDPLVDAALSTLAVVGAGRREAMAGAKTPVADPALLHAEARRVLRRLCEAGAVLAVAKEMEKAVVVRDSESGAGMRTAIVDRDVAGALALNDWIAGSGSGKVRRYMITSSGRAALNRLLAEQETAARAGMDNGLAEAPGTFAGKPVLNAATTEAQSRRSRYGAAESPLLALARRRDRDGQPFLSDDLVRAGERLREDFELAQIGPSVAQDWSMFLTAGVKGGHGDSDFGTTDVRARLQNALTELGPGLGEVALRCCCMLEGLETAEKRMGWSARSGKIVLRIALQRLKRHYDAPASQDRLIG